MGATAPDSSPSAGGAPYMYMHRPIPRKRKHARPITSDGAAEAASVPTPAVISAHPGSNIRSLRIPKKKKGRYAAAVVAAATPASAQTPSKPSATATAKPTFVSPVVNIPAKSSSRGNGGPAEGAYVTPVVDAPSERSRGPPAEGTAHEKITEGRFTGYPVVVAQGKSEHDAILLECEDNPEQFLANNVEGKVKVRWKHAGYNSQVPTDTVRLKHVHAAPPIRKAAMASGLSHKGGKGAIGINEAGWAELDDEEAPILKAARLERMEDIANEKDGDYNDKEDRDEPLVCYTKSNSVGLRGRGEGPTTSASVPSGNEREELSGHRDGSGEAIDAETGTNAAIEGGLVPSDEPKPFEVASGIGIKSEDADTDDEMEATRNGPTSTGQNLDTVGSNIAIKAYDADTDDDEAPKPEAVTSSFGIKAEIETDDETDPAGAGNVGAETDDGSETERFGDGSADIKPEEAGTDDEAHAPVRQAKNANEESKMTTVASGFSADIKAFLQKNSDILGAEQLSEKRGVNEPLPDIKRNIEDVPSSNLLPAKRSERVCAACKVKVPKSLNDFSKSQRGKGAKARCKECVAANRKAPADGGDVEAGIAEKNAVVFETTWEHVCSACMASKQMQHFTKSQRGKGAKARCKDCVQNNIVASGCNEEKATIVAKSQEVEEKRLNKKMLEEEAEKEPLGEDEEEQSIQSEDEQRQMLEKYDNAEARHCKRRREEYDAHAKRLEELGRSIEEEMTAVSDLLYVVTSISKSGYGDPFNPSLHGAYTTCQKAQDAARKVFEGLSETYRDGEWLDDSERIAKCDTLRYLIPGTEFTSRAMFELFGEDDDAECNAVGITSIRINRMDGVDLPFLRCDDFWQKDGAVNEGPTVPLVGSGMQVHMVFSYWPGNMGYSSADVNLCGIYTKKEDAVRSGLDFTNFNDNEAKEEQLARAPNVESGKIFWEMDHDQFAVVLETVLLDECICQKDIDIGTMGDGCWDNCTDMEFY